MHPILFSLGPLKIYAYGFMLAIAFLLCGQFFRRDLQRRGKDPALADAVLMAALIGGIVGARLWSIAEKWESFLADPLGGLLSGSGLVFYGGAIGGTLAVIWAVRRRGERPIEIADMVFPLLLLGYGCGRIGCMLAGDGDFGGPSGLPFPLAVSIPNALVPPNLHPALIGTGVTANTPLLNTPLFEVVASCGLFAWIWPRRLHHPPVGQLLGLGMCAMALERFIIEFVRLNERVLGPLTAAQLFSVGLFAAGIAVLWAAGRHRFDSPAQRAAAIES